MRAKAVILSLLLLLVPGLMFAGTTGKIKGKVTDKESKESLVGASVSVVGTSYGAASDVNGEYTILNVPAGVYTVKATYVGYSVISVSKVTVNSDFTTDINLAMSSEAVALGGVEIVAQRPLINKDYTNTTTIKSADDINELPIRGVTNVVGLQASVVQNEGSNLLYIRGGRSSEVAYLIDGVSVNNPMSGNASQAFTNVNQNNVEELQMQTGGFNAEYGSAMSGLVNLNTKSGGSKYTVSAEVATDAMQKANIGDNGGWGFNVYNLSVGGPIVPDNNVASLYLSAERQQLKDNDPHSVGGVKPNTETKSWNFNGKLTVRPVNEIDIKLGGYLYTQKGNNWDNIRRFADAEHMQRFDNKSLSLFARMTHNVGSNIFYTVQASLFNEKLQSGDGVWFDNLFAYGDPARNPALKGVSTNPDRLFSTIAAPGEVFNAYGKSSQTTISLTGDVSLQAGNHLVKVGGEYRTYKVRVFGSAASQASGGDGPMGLANPANSGWALYRNSDFQYYGYSYDGTSEYDGADQFFTSGDAHKEGPKKPLYIAGYVQDKFEVADLVLNVGFRVDHFDAKEEVAIDPQNPFGAKGTPGGGVFEQRDLKKSTPTTTVSPRLGFSFPITDRAHFHAQYGTFLQMPALQYVLISKTWFDRYASGDAGFSTRIPNPDLKPERTISYEIGFQTLVTDNFSVSITGFYKEIKDLIQSRNVGTATAPAYPSSYETFENVDFGTVKGFDFILALRRTKNVAVTLNYTLGFANGTGSDPNTQSRLSWIQTENPKIVVPLDFDRRHVGSLNVDYRTSANEGPMLGDVYPFEKAGLSVLFTFNSGVPYTQSVITNPFYGGVTEVRPTGAINGSYTPWNFRFDLKLDRSFNVGPLNMTASLSVLNLLNADNVNSVARLGIDGAGTTPGVYRGTGLPDNSGFLTSPEGQQEIAKYAGQTVNVNGRPMTYTQVFQGREANPANFGIPRQIRFGLRLEY